MRAFLTSGDDPFRAVWRFIRYDDYEIFEADDAYFDRQAREIAEAGFTHVMTFSDTHFRWSFRRDFERLTEVLRRQVAACHRYGLRVVEHHSANLSWNYQTPAQRVEALRHADPARWPHFEEDMSLDSIYRGVRFGDLLQVSGATGKPFISFMNSYIMCHNNPEYRRLYFDYLDTLYDTGIDGIMTDDIQFVSAMHTTGADNVPCFDMDSCACPSCREKFRRLTGYELPGPGEEWSEFMRDQYTPRFLAWKEFRYQSCLDFCREVIEWYEKRNLVMLRPNYCATSVAWVSPWAFAFDELPALDWAFTEHCCGIIRYSWPEYLFESVHTNMVARQRHIPALALYYPELPDAQRMSWGLALWAGQRFFGDPTRRELFADQQRFHRFEEEHFDALFKLEEHAELAFFDSRPGRELEPEYNTTVRTRFNSLAQACIRFNVPWVMVSENHPEEFDRYRVIVVPGTRFLSGGAIAALTAFAARGGRLVWCDDAGLYDAPSGRRRDSAEIETLLAPAGNNLIRIGSGEYLCRYSKRCRVKNHADRDAFDCSEPSRWREFSDDELAEAGKAAAFLSSLLPEGCAALRISGAPRDLLLSGFFSIDAGIYSLRLVNLAGTQRREPRGGYGMFDPIPFPELENKLNIRIRKPDNWTKEIRSARLCSLEGSPRNISFTDADGEWNLVIPARAFRESALVELT